MADTHVISALRLKRAEISGHIHDLERKIARHRLALANIDATIRLFSPSTNPDVIPPKRPCRRTRYFAHNELSHLVVDALRLASGPIAAGDIAAAIMRAKGAAPDDEALKTVIAERVLVILRRLSKRREAVKTGASRNAQWALAPSFL